MRLGLQTEEGLATHAARLPREYGNCALEYSTECDQFQKKVQ